IGRAVLLEEVEHQQRGRLRIDRYVFELRRGGRLHLAPTVDDIRRVCPLAECANAGKQRPRQNTTLNIHCFPPCFVAPRKQQTRITASVSEEAWQSRHHASFVASSPRKTRQDAPVSSRMSACRR